MRGRGSPAPSVCAGAPSTNCRVAERRERDPKDSLWVLLRARGGGLERESGLARAARAGQREQGSPRAPGARATSAELALAAEERRRGTGRFVSVRCSAAELAFAELIEPLRGRQVLEPVLPEIP